MTSLNFHSLLKQEKALRRAELAEKTVQRKSVDVVQSRDQTKPPSSTAVAARSNDDPVGSKELVASGLCSGQEETRIFPFKELALQAKVDMEKQRVGTIPSIFYAPKFVSEEDEKQILARTFATPSGETDKGWVVLRTRRLKCWGGQPGKDFQPEPLPQWLESLCDVLVKRGVFSTQERPNHVLLNEYQPGEGIMPHTDGPFYAPRTATLSLGSDAIMHFSPRIAAEDIGKPGVDSSPLASLVLRERCLVVFTDDAYCNLLHGIDAVSEENVGKCGAPVINAHLAETPEGTIIRRRFRVSLTFRQVRCSEAGKKGG